MSEPNISGRAAIVVHGGDNDADGEDHSEQRHRVG